MYSYPLNMILAIPEMTDGNMDEEPQSSRSPENPGKSPEKEPGEIYVIVMTVIGVLLGAAIGYFIAVPVVSFFLVLLSVAGGAILGGTAGAFVGGRMKDVKAERDKKKPR